MKKLVPVLSIYRQFFVHAYELTLPVLVSSLFALKKARAADQNVDNH